jgi:methionyl-tRNA formyltransferase
MNFVFFGTGQIAVHVFDALISSGQIPALVVTNPDAAKGRGYELAASPIKERALKHNLPILQPEKIDGASIEAIRQSSSTVGVVVDYGKILPQELLDIFPRGILNMHPSLLPRLRGPSPIRSAILTDQKDNGVTIMLVDKELDHGPIVAQKKITTQEWPPRGRDFDTLLAQTGASLMAEILPLWEGGELEAREQNHDVATYCSRIEKSDALINLSGDAYANLLKIKAYDEWPIAYSFFVRANKKIRVQILDAHLEGKKLIIDRVKPEGKGEITYAEFIRSGASPVA